MAPVDLRSSASFAHGHPAGQYRWLRDHAPVYWYEEPGGRGFWAVTRYDLVRAASADHETYCNGFGIGRTTRTSRSAATGRTTALGRTSRGCR
jgi:cytochrome P450